MVRLTRTTWMQDTIPTAKTIAARSNSQSRPLRAASCMGLEGRVLLTSTTRSTVVLHACLQQWWTDLRLSSAKDCSSLSSADPVTPPVLPSSATTVTANWARLHRYLYVNTTTEFTSGQGYKRRLCNHYHHNSHQQFFQDGQRQSITDISHSRSKQAFLCCMTAFPE